MKTRSRNILIAVVIILAGFLLLSFVSHRPEIVESKFGHTVCNSIRGTFEDVYHPVCNIFGYRFHDPSDIE